MSREDRLAPVRGGAIPVTEPRSAFIPGREPVFFLISFTSGISDCRCHDVWKTAYSYHRIRGASPTSHKPWWLTDTSGVDRRQGYYCLAAKLTYFIRRA